MSGRWKVIYKITWPNGKIYIGSDLTDSIGYFGSVSNSVVEKDFPTRESRKRIQIMKEIIFESDQMEDHEIRVKEFEFIELFGSNNPAKGYNLRPRYREPSAQDSAHQGD
ncbi:GIY-YIG nuclease family protein [Rhabdaerophilum sp. SD176]|uniref:GIY-YIG nuclease family protein n=1 Tax=Rhabdaerophilum sp. SD176 TaxID=2983548 RepID=UPI0024DFE7A2|nr:GIY-YIG nuclease family protein [Rhabdaerophilum sp. SD176]